MQAELDTNYPSLGITLYGINMPGHEAGVDLMIDGHTIGLLQDTTTVDATTAWGGTWRDVYVLDEDNRVVEIINLTSSNLATQSNYDYLRDLLVTTATD